MTRNISNWINFNREETGVSVPIEILYEAKTDISLLSLYVRDKMNAVQSSSDVIDLTKECTLDTSITISPSMPIASQGPILLTGCTGFLGAYLLYP